MWRLGCAGAIEAPFEGPGCLGALLAWSSAPSLVCPVWRTRTESGKPGPCLAASVRGCRRHCNRLLLWLGQEQEDDGIFANALNPGAIATHLQRHTGRLQTPPERRKSIEQGAATTVLLAGSALLNGVGGLYFEDCNEAHVVHERSTDFRGVAPYALNPANAERLWNLAGELLAQAGKRAHT
jgi:hypothetical protein